MNTQANGNAERDPAVLRMSCEDIQALLLDYQNRDLGEGRSDLIREHVRRCEACRAKDAEMQETLKLLHDDDVDGSGPLRLSDKRRDRIRFAFAHPVLDWMYRHHALSSAVVALVVIGLLLLVLRHTQAWRTERIEAGPDVTIGNGPRPQAVTEGQKEKQ